MIKRIFLIFLLILSKHAVGDTFPTTYISVSNIQWITSPIPEEIKLSKELKSWYGEAFQNGISRWAYISLLDDKNQEIILQGSSPGSGGLNFLVLTKKNKKWKLLTDIHGGFIFYPAATKRHSLVIYSRIGADYFREEQRFNGEKYLKVSKTEIPIELTRLNGSPINFYNFFNFMSYGEVKK
jgi:hypothetical protein